MFPVEWTGTRVLVRDYQASDAARVWAIAYRDQGVFFAAGAIVGLEGVTDWIAGLREAAVLQARAAYRLAVVERESGLLIGFVRVDMDSPTDGRGSIGYGLGREYRGCGYASEAAAMACDFGFGELGLHRIEALIEPGNTPSIRVAERLGMQSEGILGNALHGPDGTPRDALVFRLLPTEWRQTGWQGGD